VNQSVDFLGQNLNKSSQMLIDFDSIHNDHPVGRNTNMRV